MNSGGQKLSRSLPTHKKLGYKPGHDFDAKTVSQAWVDDLSRVHEAGDAGRFAALFLADGKHLL